MVSFIRLSSGSYSDRSDVTTREAEFEVMRKEHLPERDEHLVVSTVFKTAVGLYVDRGKFDSYPLRHCFLSFGAVN